MLKAVVLSYLFSIHPSFKQIILVQLFIHNQIYNQKPFKHDFSYKGIRL